MRKLLSSLMVLFSLFFSTVHAQNVSVSGKVIDDKGNPISGVSVQEKKSKRGTTTDVSGMFNLAIKSGATLIFSSVGYATKQVVGDSVNVLNIILATDNTSLNEVVVTGVGVATSKRKLGISVESITADKLPAAPTADLGSALVGKIAGAQISSTNGSPGSPVNILLRGINSLRGGTSPMILLDGIEVRATNLQSLDLSNIERIEVVQGAASASIYGAQGANGAIQLFSKKNKSGKLNVDFSSSIAVNELLNNGGVQKAKFHSFDTNTDNEVISSDGNPLLFDSSLSHYENNVIWNSTAYATNNNKAYNKNLKWYDHYSMFFKKAYTYNNTLAISSSKDKTDYNFSISDNRQESVFKNNGNYSRTNLISNLGIELFNNLKFRTNTQLIYTNDSQLDPTGRNIFYALNNSRPFANYDYVGPDGNYGAYFGNATGVNGYNFNYINQYADVKDEKLDIIQNLSLNYKLPKFLELDAKYGINHQNDLIIYNIADQSNNLNTEFWQNWVGNKDGFSPRLFFGNPTEKDKTGEINNRQYKTTFQNFLSTATLRTDFEKDFGFKIPLRTSTQLSFDYRKNIYKQYITYGLDAPSYSPYTASQMSTYGVPSEILLVDGSTIPGDYKKIFVTYGYLFNQRIEWGEIGGISGGFRSDYSSAFGRGSKPFTFPHGDFYLRLSSINFWKDEMAKIVPEFKIRGAFGKAGIQPDAYARYRVLQPRNIGSDNTVSYPTQFSNEDLSVEVSQEKEIGIDAIFNVLKNDWLKTINLSATYWDRKTDNAIWPVDVAPSNGYGTILDNAFGLSSNGFQASLNLNAFSNKNFTWNFTANFSKQTSKITSVIGEEVVITSNAGSSNYVLKTGEKIGQLYGYFGLHSVDQINPTTGQSYIEKGEQANYILASNGWVVNKATRAPYFTPEQYSFGDPNPKFNMSFINDFSYKGFVNFAMQWDWVSGSHLYNQSKEWMYRDGIHKDYDQEIDIDGKKGAWASFYRGVYAQRSRNGTKNYFYENASFFRLRNISLAFDLAKLLKIKQLQKVQLVLTGRNIATITKYTGMDPEVSSGESNSAFDRGVDHNTIPNIKSFQVGLNLGF